jgi:hypothetical protein
MDALTLRRGIRKYVKRVLAAALVVASLLWTADWLLLRHRVAQDGAAFGVVEVHYSYAVRMKNKRVEQNRESSKAEECVYSMFPHYDDTPCWYLKRHSNQSQELDGRPWRFFYEE